MVHVIVHTVLPAYTTHATVVRAELNTWNTLSEVGPERSQMHNLHLAQPDDPRGRTAWNTVVIPCSSASRVTKVEPSGDCASETALVPLVYESEYAIKNCLTLLDSDLIFLYLKHIFLNLIYYTIYKYVLKKY